MNCVLAKIKNNSPVAPGKWLWLELCDPIELHNTMGDIVYAFPTPYRLKGDDAPFCVEQSMIDFSPFFAEIKKGRSLSIIENYPQGEAFFMDN